MSPQQILNIRFYDFMPQSIECMAYNESSDTLALCRGDGTIELWNCVDHLFKEFELIGLHDDPIKGLAWCKNRLFSAGLQGFLYEYDLNKRQIARQVPITGGPTWCLEASPNQSYLAAGTENGSICVFEVIPGDLLYKDAFPSEKTRVLSLGWHPNNDNFVTGSEEFVHVWSLKRGLQLDFKLSMNENNVGPVIWCIAVLKDMTIVTGDSNGCISVYNGTSGSQLQQLKTHQADILSLCTFNYGKSIWFGGADPVISKLELVQQHDSRKKWVQTVSRRHHTHDVKAMVMSRGKLYSGGDDTHLFCTSFPVSIIQCRATPPAGFISTANKSNGILLGYPAKVELWRFGSYANKNHEGLTENRVKIAEIHLKKKTILRCCSVSPKSDVVAYATTDGCLHMFTIVHQKEGESIRIVKINSQIEKLQPSLQLKWLDDERLISASDSGLIQVLLIKGDEVTMVEEWKVSDAEIRLMNVSSDRQFVVVTDSKQHIYVRNMTTAKTVMLPQSKFIPTSCSVNSETHEIFATDSGSNIIEFNFVKGKFTKFHRAHKCSNSVLQDRKQAITSCFSDVGNPSKIFMSDASSIVVLDKLAQPSTDIKVENGNDDFRQNKRRKKEPTAKQNVGRFHFVDKQSNILYFETMQKGLSVCIEQNPETFEQSLPMLLRKKQFGV